MTFKERCVFLRRYKAKVASHRKDEEIGA